MYNMWPKKTQSRNIHFFMIYMYIWADKTNIQYRKAWYLCVPDIHIRQCLGTFFVFLVFSKLIWWRWSWEYQNKERKKISNHCSYHLFRVIETTFKCFVCRQGAIDSRMNPSKKTRFQKTHPRQYDKKSLKKRKEKISHNRKPKKKIKARN